MREIAEECGRPLSFSLIQLSNDLWRDHVSGLAKGAACRESDGASRSGLPRRYPGRDERAPPWPAINVVLDRLGEMIALDTVPNCMPQPGDTMAYKAQEVGKEHLYLAGANYASFSSAVVENFLTAQTASWGWAKAERITGSSAMPAIRSAISAHRACPAPPPAFLG